MTYAGRHQSVGTPGSETPDTELVEAARAWAADDPDPQTRAELDAVIAAATSGDAAARDELADRMSTASRRPSGERRGWL